METHLSLIIEPSLNRTLPKTVLFLPLSVSIHAAFNGVRVLSAGVIFGSFVGVTSIEVMPFPSLGVDATVAVGEMEVGTIVGVNVA